MVVKRGGLVSGGGGGGVGDLLVGTGSLLCVSVCVCVWGVGQVRASPTTLMVATACKNLSLWVPDVTPRP